MRIPEPLLSELPENVVRALEGQDFGDLEDLFLLLEGLGLPSQEMESLKEELYELIPEANRLVKVRRWL